MQSIKYALVGLANTAITAVIIFACMKIGLSLYYSNALGYIVGIAFSFLVNSLFTFTTPLTKVKFVKFIICAFICYLANLIVIKVLIHIYPESVYLVQLSGMIIYTISGFIINKYWVMK